MIHPDSLNAGAYAEGRNQITNLKAVLNDILGHGNENCLLPGQLEAMWAQKVEAAGGLLFTEAEIQAFNQIAATCGAQTLTV